MSEPAHGSHPYEGRNRARSNASSIVQRLSQEFEDSRPPEGFVAVASDVASSILSVNSQPDRQTLAEDGVQTADRAEKRPTSVDEPRLSDVGNTTPILSSEEATLTAPDPDPRSKGSTEPFDNGYHFPPKYTWKEATIQGLKVSWEFFITPMGCFWTIYGLLVVAWGGMLFLLLCNAAPAMCYPTCDDIDAPRRKWIEWDAQILTVLFCVTAFGLAPWRFRDLYFLLKYRLQGQHDGLRRLAGIHNSWFRLQGTQELPVNVGPDTLTDDVPKRCVPLPESSMPRAPLTGTRAPATAVWKLDFVIWNMVWNTFAQMALCGLMWGMNRYDRPSWATGFLIGIGMVIAMVGGYVMFLEGKKAKRIEGVPLTDRDRERLARDKELGIPHYNNIKDKKPKEKRRKRDSEK